MADECEGLCERQKQRISIAPVLRNVFAIVIAPLGVEMIYGGWMGKF